MVSKTVKGTLLAAGVTLIGAGSNLMIVGGDVLLQGALCMFGGLAMIGVREVIKDAPVKEQ